MKIETKIMKNYEYIMKTSTGGESMFPHKFRNLHDIDFYKFSF